MKDLETDSAARVDEWLDQGESRLQCSLSPEEIKKLLHVNARLIDLEQAIYARMVDLHSNLYAIENPAHTGLRWDDFDPVTVEVWMIFKTDPMRPSYRPDDDILESLTIRRELSLLPGISTPGDFDPANPEYWGIGDRNCHNTLPAGHALRDYPLCTLFHEMYDHWSIGLKDILQLERIWFDIRLQQSGCFTL